MRKWVAIAALGVALACSRERERDLPPESLVTTQPPPTQIKPPAAAPTEDSESPESWLKEAVTSRREFLDAKDGDRTEAYVMAIGAARGARRVGADISAVSDIMKDDAIRLAESYTIAIASQRNTEPHRIAEWKAKQAAAKRQLEPILSRLAASIRTKK